MAKFITENLAQVIAARSLPGITIWNRLEGRPRAAAFDRALRADVRDALWMVTRQWQLGEFRGDDAGSPVVAKVRVETTRLRKYRPADGAVEPFDDDVPLEARVEAMPIVFEQAGHEMSLDIRLLLGRHWLSLISPLGAAVRDAYVAAYPIREPDPFDPADAATCAHPEAWALAASAAGRCMDGAKLYLHLEDAPANRASDGIAGLTAAQKTQADRLGDRFVAWFARLIAQPADTGAWVANRLEYEFACAATERRAATGPDGAVTTAHEKVLAAEEYYHGRLDWYAFDVDRETDVIGEPTPPDPDQPSSVTLSMLPAQVAFNGMPNTRWWTFEDGKTNFGDVKPDTTDLAKLMLIEFALIYANDWYLVPLSVPSGSIATVRGVAVANVFGERIWVDAAGAGDDEDWQRWAMFLLSVKGNREEPADLSLVIPPVAQQVIEGAPLEVVTLARDEMANSVWAIEQTIPLPSGDPKPGREAAYETRAYFEREAERRLGAPPEPPAFAEGAQIRYEVMSSVPENWIPLIPVHVPGDSREIQLQRAAILRIVSGDPASPPVEPRTSLLRPGLDEDQPYFVHEEQVSRASIRVTQGFQRTRWRDGRAWTWLGVRKQTGAGESSSGLAFDLVVDRPRT